VCVCLRACLFVGVFVCGRERTGTCLCGVIVRVCKSEKLCMCVRAYMGVLESGRGGQTP